MVQCPMELHGQSMVSTIESSWEYPWISIGIPWSFHGILEYGHAFVLTTHGFSMYFPWLKHGISCGVLSMAIEKAWEFHEKPMDFHGQYDKFSKYGRGFPWNTSNHGFTMSLPCYFLWISMVFPSAYYEFVPMVLVLGLL